MSQQREEDYTRAPTSSDSNLLHWPPRHTQRGGPPIKARARRLDKAEYARAGRLLRRKYPLLQGVMVPWTHRLMRNKTGRTVHFALTPTEQVGDHGPLPVLVTPPGVH
jgi:hypothetical protein